MQAFWLHALLQASLIKLLRAPGLEYALRDEDEDCRFNEAIREHVPRPLAKTGRDHHHADVQAGDPLRSLNALADRLDTSVDERC